MEICKQLKCIHPPQPIQHFSEDLKKKEQGFEPEPSCGFHDSLLNFFDTFNTSLRPWALARARVQVTEIDQ